MGEALQFPNLLRAVMRTPWAIDPNSMAWAAIVDVLSSRVVGVGFTDAEITARIEAASNGPRRGQQRQVGVAVIPVYGVISARQNMMSQTSGGGTSAEQISEAFRSAMRDDEAEAVIFDIDSPGGSVEGIQELAAEIRDARGKKPIVSVANHMAASAAYWFGSAADEFVASPSATVGSVGVFTAHEDLTEALAQKGVKRTVISAGKYKAEGALGQALSEEARTHVQGQVDQFYDMMVTSIAKSRGVSAKVVRDGYGQGRSMLAKPALEAKVIDRIDTLENTIRRVAKQAAAGPIRAEEEESLVANLEPEADPPARGWARERIALALAEAEYDFTLEGVTNG